MIHSEIFETTPGRVKKSQWTLNVRRAAEKENREREGDIERSNRKGDRFRLLCKTEICKTELCMTELVQVLVSEGLLKPFIHG